MSKTMENSPFGSRRHDHEVDFDLKEWGLKARISRENTNSRRFSASNLISFREEATSFRSNITISSTTSSPGYTAREIDPSTYSFTTALKALQAKTIYTWEHLSPDKGYTLNSKWSEAEKYICNPLSGRVPMECLSAKTLSGRSFRSITSRITMSAPLIYPSMGLQQFCPDSTANEHENEINSDQEKLKMITTRDIGTQSTPVDVRSRSPSPISTPSIEERSMKKSENEGGESSVSSGKIITSAKEVEAQKLKEESAITPRNEGDRDSSKGKKASTCSCLYSLIKTKRIVRSSSKPSKNTTLLHHIKAC